MNAGAHVLVEKPMCMTVEEADQMIQASKQNNVKLGLVHSFIFTPAVRNALKEVKKGTIGDLIKVDTVISIKSLLEWEKAPGFPKWYYGLQGGLFGEILPHGLYIQLAFLGHVEKILGVTSGENSGKLTPFSELLVVMKCNKGVGNMFLSTRIQTPHTVLFVRAVGSKGVLYVSVPSATLTLTKMRSSISMVERALFNLEPAGQLLSGTIAMPAKMLSRSFKPHMTHNIIIKEFVENVRHGREPPVTAEEGREVIKATDMIWKNVLDWSK
jgi:predicted dehydrogenase